jgi:hypothetical protein
MSHRLLSQALSLVGGGEDDAASDRDRLAPQARIEQLLYRAVEGVEVGMEDVGLRRHGVIYSHIPRIRAFRSRGGMACGAVRRASTADQTRCSKASRTWRGRNRLRAP